MVADLGVIGSHQLGVLGEGGSRVKGCTWGLSLKWLYRASSTGSWHDGGSRDITPGLPGISTPDVFPVTEASSPVRRKSRQEKHLPAELGAPGHECPGHECHCHRHGPPSWNQFKCLFMASSELRHLASRISLPLDAHGWEGPWH